jgi:hypothetical protein
MGPEQPTALVPRTGPYVPDVPAPFDGTRTTVFDPRARCVPGAYVTRITVPGKANGTRPTLAAPLDGP